MMDLRSNYDRLMGGEDNEESESYQLYDSPLHVRKLVIVMPDGTRHFFNYAHLMDGSFYREESRIQLTFTTGAIVLSGLRLETLFDSLTFEMVKVLMIVEERYVQTIPDGAAVVTKIEVSKN